MKGKPDLSDLFIALSLENSVTENVLRLFLYLISKILNSDNAPGFESDITTKNCYLESREKICEALSFSLDEYLEAKSFLTNHHLMICQEINDKELWFNENSNRWFLKSLGPNLIEADDIDDPKILMTNHVYKKLFNESASSFTDTKRPTI